MFLHQFCDLLDGPVARECKKTSKLGGFLDNLSDYIYMSVLVFLLLHQLMGGYSHLIVIMSISALIILSTVTISIYSLQSMYEHETIKNNEVSLHGIIANNSMIATIIIILIYLSLQHQNLIKQ